MAQWYQFLVGIMIEVVLKVLSVKSEIEWHLIEDMTGERDVSQRNNSRNIYGSSVQSLRSRVRDQLPRDHYALATESHFFFRRERFFWKGKANIIYFCVKVKLQVDCYIIGFFSLRLYYMSIVTCRMEQTKKG